MGCMHSEFTAEISKLNEIKMTLIGLITNHYLLRKYRIVYMGRLTCSLCNEEHETVYHIILDWTITDTELVHLVENL